MAKFAEKGNLISVKRILESIKLIIDGIKNEEKQCVANSSSLETVSELIKSEIPSSNIILSSITRFEHNREVVTSALDIILFLTLSWLTLWAENSHINEEQLYVLSPGLPFDFDVRGVGETMKNLLGHYIFDTKKCSVILWIISMTLTRSPKCYDNRLSMLYCYSSIYASD